MEILCCDLTFSSMLVFGGGDCNQVVRTNQRVFQNSRMRGLSRRGAGVQGDTGLVEHEADTDGVHCGCCVCLRFQTFYFVPEFYFIINDKRNHNKQINKTSEILLRVCEIKK